MLNKYISNTGSLGFTKAHATQLRSYTVDESTLYLKTFEISKVKVAIPIALIKTDCLTH